MYGNIPAANAWWEKALRYIGVERTREREAAKRANAKDYHLSPESQAALDRGDRQRVTGKYEFTRTNHGSLIPMPRNTRDNVNDDTARGLYSDANREDFGE